MSAPHVRPVDPPYEPDVVEELARWMPPNAPVEPLKLFRTLARHLPLAHAMGALGRHLLSRRLSLSLREREIAIDRTCARLGCEYEWGVHATAFGEAAGLSAGELAATAPRGEGAAAFTGREALLVRVVDELCETAMLSEGLHAELRGHFDERELLELLVLVGWYHVISFVANGAGVEREAWAARFPSEEPAERAQA